MKTTTKEIPLTQGKVALVDDEYFDELSKYKWYTLRDHHYNRFYAIRHEKKEDGIFTLINMHRQILNYPAEMIDHVNHDGLDNRRSNIRVCTNSENQHNSNARKRNKNNTSGFRGVSWNTTAKRWRAAIKKNLKDIFLGYFSTAEEAGHAYDKKAKELFGEVAVLNFPQELEQNKQEVTL